MPCNNTQALVSLGVRQIYNAADYGCPATSKACCELLSTESLDVKTDCTSDIVIDITAITRSHYIRNINTGTITLSDANTIQSRKVIITCSQNNDGCHLIKPVDQYTVASDTLLEQVDFCKHPPMLHEVLESPPVMVLRDKQCTSGLVIKGTKATSKIYFDCLCCNITQQTFTIGATTYKILGQDNDGTGCYALLDQPLATDVAQVVQLTPRQIVLIGQENGCGYKFTIPAYLIDLWVKPIKYTIMYPGDTSDSIEGTITCKPDERKHNTFDKGCSTCG